MINGKPKRLITSIKPPSNTEMLVLQCRTTGVPLAVVDAATPSGRIFVFMGEACSYLPPENWDEHVPYHYDELWRAPLAKVVLDA